MKAKDKMFGVRVFFSDVHQPNESLSRIGVMIRIKK